MSACPSGDRGRHQRFAAFSLPEMLVVIALMLVLFGLAGGALKNVTESSRMSGAIQNVVTVLNQARQTALSQNGYVQVRFYEQTKPSDPSFGHYFAIGTYISDSPIYAASEYTALQAQGRFKPDTAVSVLPTGVVILKSATESKLLDAISKTPLQKAPPAVDSTARTGVDSEGRMKGYPWVAFYFDPKGGVDVPVDVVNQPPGPLPPVASFVSLCLANQYKAANALPANYAILLLDPLTGRLQLRRP